MVNTLYLSDLRSKKMSRKSVASRLAVIHNNIHIHIIYIYVFRSKGGPVWDSDVFLKSVTYRPTLSKFRGVPVKKITLYDGVSAGIWVIHT